MKGRGKYGPYLAAGVTAFAVIAAAILLFFLLEHFSASGDTVMITPGEGFYTTPGKGVNEARLAYVLKHDDLVRAMRVLAEAIEAYNNR